MQILLLSTILVAASFLALFVVFNGAIMIQQNNPVTETSFTMYLFAVFNGAIMIQHEFS